jgi:hypothetical protein
MRIVHVMIAASAVTVVGGASASAMISPQAGPVGAAPTKQARRAATPLLRPLTERDQTSARGTGCQLSFTTRNNATLVYAIENELIVRTRAGRSVCRISDNQFGALSSGGTRSCGGVRINIRRTGRSVGNQASDSSSAPATLTATEGRRTWTTRGYWGSAC